MQMIALHREVHDPKALARVAHLGERGRDRAEAALGTQVPDAAPHADRHVMRVPRVDGRTALMGKPGTDLFRPATTRALLELLSREERPLTHEVIMAHVFEAARPQRPQDLPLGSTTAAAVCYAIGR
jgi:hypothetical protein